MEAIKATKLPRVTLHSLRHTHASHLIASGMDVLTISRRLGHGSPTITLGVYGHLFPNTDDRAAQIMEAALCRRGWNENKKSIWRHNRVAIWPIPLPDSPLSD